ncbi:MAG: MBL fold metallo-hydrolase [Armatimonadia bacterium]|nr:MBL fold metallo-hydrolase [Armatimonadia bacterium]
MGQTCPMNTLTPLCNGRCAIAGNHLFHGGDPSERYDFALLVWLIEGPAGPCLVDAGLRHVDEMNEGAAHVLAEPITQRPEEDVRALLSARGLAPEDIRTVVVTHLHFDHVDNLDLFTEARIVVSERGFREATKNPGWAGSWAPGKTLEGLTGPWADRVTLTDNAEVLPGIGTVWLGGHSPCSQGVLVATERGDGFLTGDVIFRWENLEQGRPIGVFDDLPECEAALARIAEMDAAVLPGHDPRVLHRYPDGFGGGP